MKTKTYFKKGKNDIHWLSSNFQEHFGDLDFVEVAECTLQVKKLERDMLDKEILTEWKPEESTLGELAYALKNWENIGLLRDDYANIFYIRDKDKILWAVLARWDSGRGGWYVHASSIEDPYEWRAGSHEWRAGSRVVSRNYAFRPSDSSDLESRMKNPNTPRSKYWNTMVDILDGQFPKGKCKERGQALVVLAYTELMLQGWDFDTEGHPLIKKI